MQYGIGYSPEVDLAVQVILNCDMVDQGCHGGDPNTAYQFISQAGGIPSETCQLYEAEVRLVMASPWAFFFLPSIQEASL